LDLLTWILSGVLSQGNCAVHNRIGHSEYLSAKMSTDCELAYEARKIVWETSEKLSLTLIDDARTRSELLTSTKRGEMRLLEAYFFEKMWDNERKRLRQNASPLSETVDAPLLQWLVMHNQLTSLQVAFERLGVKTWCFKEKECVPSLLELASIVGNIETMWLLFRHGAIKRTRFTSYYNKIDIFVPQCLDAVGYNDDTVYEDAEHPSTKTEIYPLHLAAYTGQVELAEKLVSDGQHDWNNRAYSGIGSFSPSHSVLTVAVARGNLRFVKRLLEKEKVDPYFGERIERKDPFISAMLHAASTSRTAPPSLVLATAAGMTNFAWQWNWVEEDDGSLCEGPSYILRNKEFLASVETSEDEEKKQKRASKLLCAMVNNDFIKEAGALYQFVDLERYAHMKGFVPLSWCKDIPVMHLFDYLFARRAGTWIRGGKCDTLLRGVIDYHYKHYGEEYFFKKNAGLVGVLAHVNFVPPVDQWGGSHRGEKYVELFKSYVRCALRNNIISPFAEDWLLVSHYNSGHSLLDKLLLPGNNTPHDESFTFLHSQMPLVKRMEIREWLVAAASGQRRLALLIALGRVPNKERDILWPSIAIEKVLSQPLLEQLIYPFV